MISSISLSGTQGRTLKPFLVPMPVWAYHFTDTPKVSKLAQYEVSAYWGLLLSTCVHMD
jgi:hypothetical protein